MPLSPYSSCQIPGKLQTLQISGELIFLRMYGLYTLDFFGCFLSLIASFRRMQKLERRSPAGSSLKLLFPFFVSFMKTLWALMQILNHLQRWAKLISSNLHEFSNLNKTEKELGIGCVSPLFWVTFSKYACLDSQLSIWEAERSQKYRE